MKIHLSLQVFVNQTNLRGVKPPFKSNIMEFKGTKGKWEHYKPLHIGSDNVSFGDQTGFNPYIEIWHCQFENKEEAKANALLISKAPEMLEMLKKIFFGNDYKNPSLHMEIKQLIKEATEL
jgi:hypothetical protein